MKRKRFSLITHFFLIITPFTLWGQHQINIIVIANGGSTLVSGSNRIIGTLGQSLIGKTYNQSYSVESGFWEQLTNLVTRVEEIDDKVLPKEFNLYQNYPNPFNPSTTIQFAIPKESFTKLEIFNAIGEKVSTLILENLSAGIYEYEWNAEGLPSGVYLYRLSTENFTQTKKLLLMK